MKRARTHSVTWLLSTLLVATGCSQPSTPPPPTLDGRLIVLADYNLYVLSDQSTPETPVDKLHLAGPYVYRPVVSRDGRYLVYELGVDQGQGGGGEVRLHDLETGETRTLLSVTSIPECLSWGWTSDKLGIVNGPEFSVIDPLSGSAQLVYTAPSAGYTADPLVAQAGQGSAIHGKVTCGHWVGPDQILFTRFAGPLPGRVTSSDDPKLAPNRLTLAALGDPVTLEDYPGGFSLLDVSSDGAYFLVSPLPDLKAYVIRAFPPQGEALALDAIQGRELAVPPGALIFQLRFAPGSNEVYYVGEGGVHFINPETLEERVGPEMDIDFRGDWTWVGGPARNLVAASRPVTDRSYQIDLMDLNTGGRRVLAELPASGAQFVAWVPSP